MKTKLQMAILMVAFLKPVFGSDLPYSISYQDRGTVIQHKTCRIAYHIDDVNVGKYVFSTLDSSMTEFLSEKGYRPYLSKNLFYSRVFDDVSKNADGDLALKITNNMSSKGFHFEANLGYLGETLKEKEGKLIPNKILEVPQMEVSSKNKSSKEIKKAWYQIFESLPSCASSDSGHSYEDERFNNDIVRSELSICLLEYNNQYRHLFENSDLFPLSPTLIGREHVREVRQFLKNLKNCQDEQCVALDITNDLTKSSKKFINKYLKHIGASAFVQSATNYIAENRLCSNNAKSIRELTLKTILEAVQKTL